MDLFHENGHLTDEALRAALDESLDETGCLEVAEHLSFCDACLVRYTDLLDDSVLLTPQNPIAPNVIKRVRQKMVRIFYNRYVTVAAAVALALVFWGLGIFDGVKPSSMHREHQVVQSAPVSVSAKFNTFFRYAYSSIDQTLSGLLPSTQNPEVS